MIRSFSFLTALFIMLAVAVPHPYAAGEEVRTEAGAVSEAALETAPVEIDGQALFRVRGGPA